MSNPKINEFSVFLPFEPVAKGRPRLSKYGAYTPEKTRKAELNIKIFLQIKKAPLFESPVALELLFKMKRPKSVSKKKRPEHTVKPDLSNLIKLVEDAANRILYNDDSQILEIKARKEYAEEGEAPGTFLKIINLG